MVMLRAALVATLSVPALASDFTVGESGKQFTLSQNAGRFTTVHFLLKTECPICLRTTQDYLRRADEVAGFTHVFIKPDDSDAVLDFRRKVAGANSRPKSAPTEDGESLKDLPIYRDVDQKVAAQLRVPQGYAFHGATTNFPTTIIFNQKGEEVFRYAGADTTDRFTFDRFAAEAATLTADRATKEGLHEKGSGLKGYDAVAYFGAKPQKGVEAISSSYRGITYRFATKSNRARFAKDPETFLPQYGGWCAYAMAKADKVEIDPKTFKIVGGKLYLFYNGFLGNTLNDWNKKESDLQPKADAAWQKIITKE